MEEVKKVEELKILGRSWQDTISILLSIISFVYYIGLILNSHKAFGRIGIVANYGEIEKYRQHMKGIYFYWLIPLGIILLVSGLVLGIIAMKSNKKQNIKQSFVRSGLFLNIILILIILLLTTTIIALKFKRDKYRTYHPVDEKPIIYLYPETKQDITVQLFYDGELDITYPQYNNSINGWEVKAFPDGKLINSVDNKEYSYLFWEGRPNKFEYNLSKGFIVEGKNTVTFLQKTLSEMGLMPKEYNEFIVYWAPKMQKNKYNFIYFAGKEYTESAQLKITPKPDSILRVFMVFKALEEKINIETQEIESFKRKGFSVVEWGGTELVD